MTRKLGGLIFCLLAAAFCAGPAMAQSNPGFDNLKSLAGDWEGTTENGKHVQVSYKLTAGGSVVMEFLRPSGESEMVTMYYLNGSSLMMTHYCPTGNQPRMRAARLAAGGREISFDFVGATNLASPTVGHMHKLTVQFEDKDHFIQRWTWRENGKDSVQVFHFTRKR